MKRTTRMVAADGTAYDVPDDLMEDFKADFGDEAEATTRYRAEGEEYDVPDRLLADFKADFGDRAEALHGVTFANGETRHMTVGEIAEFLRSDEYRNGERYAADRDEIKRTMAKRGLPTEQGSEAFAYLKGGVAGAAEGAYYGAKSAAGKIVSALPEAAASIAEAAGNVISGEGNAKNDVGEWLRKSGRDMKRWLGENVKGDVYDENGNRVKSGLEKNLGYTDDLVKVGEIAGDAAGMALKFAPAAVAGPGYVEAILAGDGINAYRDTYDAAIEKGFNQMDANIAGACSGLINYYGGKLLMKSGEVAGALTKDILGQFLLGGTVSSAAMAAQAAGNKGIENTIEGKPFFEGMGEAAGEAAMEGGVFHVLNAAGHSGKGALDVRRETAEMKRMRKTNLLTVAEEDGGGEFLDRVTRSEGMDEAVRARREGKDVSRKMAEKADLPDNMSAEERNKVVDSIIAHRDMQAERNRVKMDDEQYMALSEEVANRVGTDQSEDYASVMLDVMNGIKDAKELDDPYRREELVKKATEANAKEEEAERSAEQKAAADEVAAHEKRQSEISAAFNEQTRAQKRSRKAEAEAERKRAEEEYRKAQEEQEAAIAERAAEEKAEAERPNAAVEEMRQAEAEPPKSRKEEYPEYASWLKRHGRKDSDKNWNRFVEENDLDPRLKEGQDEGEVPNTSGQGGRDHTPNLTAERERIESMKQRAKENERKDKQKKINEKALEEKARRKAEMEEYERQEAERKAREEAEQNEPKISVETVPEVAVAPKVEPPTPDGRIENYPDYAAWIKRTGKKNSDKNWRRFVMENGLDPALIRQGEKEPYNGNAQNRAEGGVEGAGARGEAETGKERGVSAERVEGVSGGDMSKTPTREGAEGEPANLTPEGKARRKRGQRIRPQDRVKPTEEPISEPKDEKKENNDETGRVRDEAPAQPEQGAGRTGEPETRPVAGAEKGAEAPREGAREGVVATVESLHDLLRGAAVDLAEHAGDPNDPGHRVRSASKEEILAKKQEIVDALNNPDPQEFERFLDKMNSHACRTVALRQFRAEWQRLHPNVDLSSTPNALARTRAALEGDVESAKEDLSFHPDSKNRQAALQEAEKKLADFISAHPDVKSSREGVVAEGRSKTIKSEEPATAGVESAEPQQLTEDAAYFRDAAKGDPALRKIDAAYRAAKTDAERNALKEQFVARIAELRKMGRKVPKDAKKIAAEVKAAEAAENAPASAPSAKGTTTPPKAAEAPEAKKTGDTAKPAAKEAKRNPADNFKGYTYDDYGAPPNTDEATAKTDPGGTGDVRGAALLSHRKESNRLFYIPESKDDPLWDWYQKFNDGNARKNRRGDFIALFGMKPKKGRNDAFGDDFPPELWSLRDKGAEAVADAMLKARKDYAEWVAKKRNGQREAKAERAEGDAAFNDEAAERAAAADLSLESMTPEQQKAADAKLEEQKKAAAEKAEIERRKSASLNGGGEDVRQGKLDLGGAEGEDTLWDAASGELIDTRTGEILYSKNPDYSPLKPETKPKGGKSRTIRPPDFAMADPSRAEGATKVELPEIAKAADRPTKGEEAQAANQNAARNPNALRDPNFTKWAKKKGRAPTPFARREYDRQMVEKATPLFRRVFPGMNITIHDKVEDPAKWTKDHPNGTMKLIRAKSGEVLGWYTPDFKEMHLNPGATVEVVAHEMLHAAQDWAKTNSPKLAAALKKIADDCPRPLKQRILRAYGTADPAAIIKEWGAFNFMGGEQGGKGTGGKAIMDELAKRENASWAGKFWNATKDIWKDMAAKMGGNRIDLSAIDSKTPQEAMDYLARAMAQGGTLGKLGAKNSAAAPKGIDMTAKLSAKEKWEVNLHDYRNPLKWLRDEMAKRGVAFGDNSDFYEAALLQKGKDQAAVNDANRRIEKYHKMLKDSGITHDEMVEYMMAQAAKDRNAMITERNGKLDGSALSDAEAQKTLDIFKSDKRAKDFERISDFLLDMQTEGLQYRVDTGLLDAETAQGWLDREPAHVPFRSAIDAKTGDYSDWGARGSFAKKEFMTAEGRKTLAGDVISWMFDEFIDAHTRGNENVTRKMIADAMRLLPDAGVGKVLLSDGTARESRRSGDGGLRNVLTFKEGGAAHVIEFAEGERGERLQAAVNGRDLKSMGKLWKKGMRFWSSTATELSPTFAVRNAVADNIDVFGNYIGEYGAIKGHMAYAKHVKNAVQLIPSLIQYLYTGKPPKGEIGKLIERYEKAGGQIAGFKNEGYSDIVAKVDLAQKRGLARGKAIAGAVVDTALAPIRGVNAFAELSTRLAAFKTQVEMGMSDHKAALWSRQSTVDFNMKGNLTGISNGLYMFSNSTLGASARQLKSLFNSKHGWSVAGSFLAYGFVEGMAEALMNGDDEERGKRGEGTGKDMNEYTRANSIYVRKGENVYRVPFHAGPFSFLKYIGNCAARYSVAAIKDKDLHGEIAAQLGKEIGKEAVSQLFHYTGLGSVNFQSQSGKFTDDAKMFIGTATPTIIQPFVQGFGNIDYAGRSIYNEPFPGEKTPRSEKGRTSTPEWAKGAAEWLNEKTRKDGEIKGYVDLPPEVVKMAGEAVGKNLLRDVMNAGTVIGMFMGSEKVDVRNIPVARDFVRKVDGNDRRFSDAMKEYGNLTKENQRKSLDDRLKAIRKLRKMEQGFWFATGKATPHEWPQEKLDEFKERRRKLQAEFLEGYERRKK